MILWRKDKIETQHMNSKMGVFLWLIMQLHGYFATNHQNSRLNVKKYELCLQMIFFKCTIVLLNYVFSSKYRQNLWLIVKIWNFSVSDKYFFKYASFFCINMLLFFWNSQLIVKIHYLTMSIWTFLNFWRFVKYLEKYEMNYPEI